VGVLNEVTTAVGTVATPVVVVAVVGTVVAPVVVVAVVGTVTRPVGVTTAVVGTVVAPVVVVAVVGVIVTPTPEVLLALVPVVPVEPVGLGRLVKTTAPDPTLGPPVVTTAVVPGVVGRLTIGTVPTVLEKAVEEGKVDGMVPAAITAARLGLRLDVLVRVTVRRVEPTVPTVATPTIPPRIVLFAAARLLGPSAWTVKGVADAAVPEPDVPPAADCVGVPRTTLIAPGFEPVDVKTACAPSAARCSRRSACRSRRSSRRCSCRRCRCSCTCK
jgi:hypothetical protein